MHEAGRVQDSKLNNGVLLRRNMIFGDLPTTVIVNSKISIQLATYKFR